MKLILLGVFVLVALCLPAGAQVICGDYTELTSRLGSPPHREDKIGRGVDVGNRMVELWTGAHEGWSLIIVRAIDMRACIMLIGEGTTQWEVFDPTRGDKAGSN